MADNPRPSRAERRQAGERSNPRHAQPPAGAAVLRFAYVPGQLEPAKGEAKKPRKKPAPRQAAPAGQALAELLELAPDREVPVQRALTVLARHGVEPDDLWVHALAKHGDANPDARRLAIAGVLTRHRLRTVAADSKRALQDRDAELDDLRRRQQPGLADIETMRAQVDRLQTDLDAAQKTIEALEDELGQSIRRAAMTAASLGLEPVDAGPVEVGDTVRAVIDQAQRRWPELAFTCDLDAADRMDLFKHAKSYRSRLAEILDTLGAYAAQKTQAIADGGSVPLHLGDVAAFVNDGSQAVRISRAAVALAESTEVMKTPVFYEKRIFPMPPVGDEPAGSRAMHAHVRISAARHPAPRLHFYDDLTGPTGRLVIGYIGEHLLSPRTT